MFQVQYRYHPAVCVGNRIRLSADALITLDRDENYWPTTPECFDTLALERFGLDRLEKYFLFHKVVPDPYCTPVYEYKLKKRFPDVRKYAAGKRTVFYCLTEASKWDGEISNAALYLPYGDPGRIGRIYENLAEKNCNFENPGEASEAFSAIADEMKDAVLLHHSVVNGTAILNIYCHDAEKHFEVFEKAVFDPDSEPVFRQGLNGSDYRMIPE